MDPQPPEATLSPAGWPASLGTLSWGGQRTGGSLVGAAAGWLLSGLSPSPLINGLLPALRSITTLLPLGARPRAGIVLQLAGVLLLLAVALKRTGSWAGWPLLAVLLFGLGSNCTLPPLRRWLLGPGRLPLARLQALGDGGALLGSLLTGLLFPLQRSLVPHFSVAAMLLLPTLPLLRRSAVAAAVPPAASAAPPPGERGVAALSPRACLQGLLFGTLFALLPLWVRTIGQGTCLDFGLVLTAYGLGRPLAPWLTAALPQRAGAGLYLAMALVLLSTLALPGWAAGALFLPLGTLAAASDAALAASLAEGGDGATALRSLERSGSLGGLVGSLGMGLLAQVLGLLSGRALVVTGFLVAAFLMPQGTRRS